MAAPFSSDDGKSVKAISAEDAKALVLGQPLHMVILVDASGSMGHLVVPVVDAVNGAVKECQNQLATVVALAGVSEDSKKTSVLLSLHTFTSTIGLDKTKALVFKTLWDCMPVATAPVWTAAQFKPDGGTPLFDSIAKILCDNKSRANLQVILVTDGDDQDSTLFRSSITVGERRYLKEVIDEERSRRLTMFGPMAIFELKGFFIGNDPAYCRELNDMGIAMTAVARSNAGLEAMSSGISSSSTSGMTGWAQQQSAASAPAGSAVTRTRTITAATASAPATAVKTAP